MAISNGFDTAQVLGALRGRIGWQQPTLAGSPMLNASLTASLSGRYFQDFHPMVTVNNLAATIEDPKADMNLFLPGLNDSAIMRVLNGVFDKPQLIESTLIFDRILRNDIPSPQYSKFVGYRLWIAPGQYSMQISRASFLFNQNVTFTLYLFHDTIVAPIYTQAINAMAGSETFITLPSWVLSYVNQNYQSGVFYIGYFQDEIQAQNAIALDEFVYRWNDTLAFGYSAFEAVRVANQWDFVRIQVPYTYRTYGMNLEIQTYKDFTNKIVKNASLFDEAIGLSMAVLVLGYEAFSVRSNLTERITKDMAGAIFTDLNNSGDAIQISPYVAGLKQRLARELGRVNRTFFSDARENKLITTRPVVYGIQ